MIRFMILAVLIGLQMAGVSGQAAPDRGEMDLSGTWSFTSDRADEGITAGWYAEGCDTSTWRQVDVPIAFDNCGPDMDRYSGAGWFRRSFRVPDAMKGRRLVIRFEGLNYNSSVWVNGKPVGENHHAFLPFDVSLNDVIRYEPRENVIAVRIDNIRTRGQHPTFEGWFGQGGFLREARLIATDYVYLSNLRIVAEPDGTGGRFTLSAPVINASDANASAALRVTITDASGKAITTLQSNSAEVAAGTEGELALAGGFEDVRPWSPDHPTLYHAEVELLQDGKPVDHLSTRFGFRKIAVKGTELLLNGAPVFLKGFNRHEDSPRTGMATDLEQARTDLVDMKRMGCNFVRLCHYPPHPRIVDICDELGLLVKIEEGLNGWSLRPDHGDPNGGFSLTEGDTPLALEISKTTLRKMVTRYMNHPSIIICSVANEPQETPYIAAGLNELIRYGKQLDPTRLWVHVSCQWKNQNIDSLLFAEDDVICINFYPAWSEKASTTTEFVRGSIAKLHKEYPNKPILITETGRHCSDQEKQAQLVDGVLAALDAPYICEKQAQVVDGVLAALDAPYICGVTFWVYAQHPWPETAFYSNGLKISPYGYISRDRKTRYKAMDVIEEAFKGGMGR